MADEPNINEEVNEEVVADESQAPEPQVEEQQEEQVEPDNQEETEAPAEESTEEEPAPEDKPPSRREQLRIQQLLQKYGPPPERPNQQQAPSQRKDQLDYQQALDADPEVIKQLEADRQAASNMSYNEGLKRAEYLEWKTSLKIDAPQVEKKYPILDPNDKENFHPAVADAMNTWYLKMSGFDPETQTVTSPGISYAEFVESNMELVEEIAGQRNAQTVKNVAKQTAQTGLRPDGSSAPRLNLNKAPQEMTMDELYASIGQKNPHKK